MTLGGSSVATPQPARRAAGVQRPDRDLVAAVRAELAAIEPARRCCRAAERAGLGRAGRGRAPTPAVGRLAVRLEAGAEADAGPRPGRPHAGRPHAGRPHAGRPDASGRRDAADRPASDGAPGAFFDWASAQSHCRNAFLRGLFLARGSLSLAGGRTHLELVVPAEELSETAARFARAGLPAGARIRRGAGVVTWKSSENVVALLRQLGGTAATLELEARVVTRSLRAHLNRVLNAETANLHRSVATARRQLAQVDALDDAGRLSDLPRSVRTVAEGRRRWPEATFTQLAQQLGTSRALVQRAFERVEDAALHLDDGPAESRS